MSFIVRIFCEHSLFSLIFWLVPGMNVVVVLSLSANLTLPASAQLLSALALVHGGQLGAGVSKIGISFSRVLRGWFWTRTLTRSGHLDGSQVRPLLVRWRDPECSVSNSHPVLLRLLTFTLLTDLAELHWVGEEQLPCVGMLLHSTC